MKCSASLTADVDATGVCLIAFRYASFLWATAESRLGVSCYSDWGTVKHLNTVCYTVSHPHQVQGWQNCKTRY